MRAAARIPAVVLTAAALVPFPAAAQSSLSVSVGVGSVWDGVAFGVAYRSWEPGYGSVFSGGVEIGTRVYDGAYYGIYSDVGAHQDYYRRDDYYRDRRYHDYGYGYAYGYAFDDCWRDAWGWWRDPWGHRYRSYRRCYFRDRLTERYYHRRMYGHVYISDPFFDPWGPYWAYDPWYSAYDPWYWYGWTPRWRTAWVSPGYGRGYYPPTYVYPGGYAGGGGVVRRGTGYKEDPERGSAVGRQGPASVTGRGAPSDSPRPAAGVNAPAPRRTDATP